MKPYSMRKHESKKGSPKCYQNHWRFSKEKVSNNCFIARKSQLEIRDQKINKLVM
jgi:hypothetical protein